VAKLRDKQMTDKAETGPAYDWRTIPLAQLVSAEDLARLEELERTGVDYSDFWEELRTIGQSAPPEAWQQLPEDYLWNIDHYLYGHPKRIRP
jgi:hypothetical protein